MRLLYLFDPEWIHQTIVALLRALHAASPALVRWISGASTASTGPGRIVFGIQFRTPLGLAAGFDKNAELLAALPDLGFGFSEVGTVTPRPQPGNPRPRLFRDVGAQSLFNRMGFNNDGATRVAERVRHARAKLPPGFVVGVNLGKNKDTPEENAASDYEAAAREFEGLADYLVLNVSSPNTPGLRGLQDSDKLRPIVEGVLRVVARWAKPVPVLVKLAPEFTQDRLHQLLSAGESWGVAGWILTNTLAGSWKNHPEITGGWSGRCLAERSAAVLKMARTATKLPIISVGGIFDSAEARRRFDSGADLIQIYSGWIFGGPRFPAQLLREINN